MDNKQQQMRDALRAIKQDLTVLGLWNYYSEEKGQGLSGACALIDAALAKAAPIDGDPVPRLSSVNVDPLWHCDGCGYENKSFERSCMACGRKKPSAAKAAKL